MKGIVFTEFLEMVEKEFGYNVVDQIIEKSNLPSGGMYTAIGTYNHAEIVSLLMNLSEEVEMDPQILLKAFGKYLFDTFLRVYPQFFDRADNAFAFLQSIDQHIHVEVKKLYPDADLPKFEHEMQGDQMVLTYKSERKMASLADGLIEKSLAHYNENCSVKKELLDDTGAEVKFTITRN